MSNLIRQWNGRTIRQRKDGYMSATDMCQACGKQFGHWKALNSTTDYLQALSVDIGIPISELLQVQKGGIADEQGAWVHREVAIDLAQWLNVQLRIQVNRWTVELMTSGGVSIAESPATTPAQIAQQVISEAETVINWTVQMLGIDETIGKQMKVDMVVNQLPHLKPSLEQAKKLIAAADPLETVGMNATQLGEQLNPVMTAKEVNVLLEGIGLQRKMSRTSTKTGKPKYFWQVTELGQCYCTVHKVTSSNTDWNGNQIKWQMTVVELLQGHFDGMAILENWQ